MRYSALAALTFFCTGCADRTQHWVSAGLEHAHWSLQRTGVSASLRGSFAVNAQVGWLSGSGGTFAHTIDGGRTWISGTVPGALDLDFRDVQALDENNAWLLSAGAPARIYKTSDGGRLWIEQYSNAEPGVFFDALSFWDDENGIAFSDPVGGLFLIITTHDGGSTWQRIPPDRLPSVLPGEAGFAASGTCLAVVGTQHVWIGTGGGQVARVLRSTDRGQSWRVAQTPLAAGSPSCGVFSLAFRDGRHGVAVGGDYSQPESRQRNCAVTSDGGKTWRLVERAPPSGYRSCVAYVPNARSATLVAVGASGSDISTDDGRTWRPLGDIGYHSVSFATDGSGWAVGADGRVARFIPNKSPESSPHATIRPSDRTLDHAGKRRS